jgi:hypothetical protein
VTFDSTLSAAFCNPGSPVRASIRTPTAIASASASEAAVTGRDAAHRTPQDVEQTIGAAQGHDQPS